MHARLASLWSVRPDRVRTDWLLAGLLTVAGELQVSVGHVAGGDRLLAALLAPLFGLAVAVRRFYPTAVGVAAGVLMPLVIALWGDPQVITLNLSVGVTVGRCVLIAGRGVFGSARRFVCELRRRRAHILYAWASAQGAEGTTRAVESLLRWPSTRPAFRSMLASVPDCKLFASWL